MASGINLPLIIFLLLALGILALTIYVGIYHFRKDLIENLFRIIKEKASQNKSTKEEADVVIAILYTNMVEVATPCYLFVNKDRSTDLLIVSLLRAALRYFNSKIEVELDGSGIVRLPDADRKSLGRMLQSEQTIESTIDFRKLPTIKKIDVLLTECSHASNAYAYLLKENNKNIPSFKPLFFIVQETLKDPRRILFPYSYE